VDNIWTFINIGFLGQSLVWLLWYSLWASIGPIMAGHRLSAFARDGTGGPQTARSLMVVVAGQAARFWSVPPSPPSSGFSSSRSIFLSSRRLEPA